MWIPVALPAGRLKLATRPSCTGSKPTVKTIGMVAVAFFAASAAGTPDANSTATGSPISSAARDGRRSLFPWANRYSIATFWFDDKAQLLQSAQEPSPQRCVSLHGAV